MRLLITLTVLLGGTSLANDAEKVGESEVDVLEVVTRERVDDLDAKFEAELYGLTKEESERVAVLRIADKPFGVDNLSAFELLGKYATSESEREDYARKYLEAAAENTIKSNAWALTIQKVAGNRDFIAEAIAKEPAIERILLETGIDIRGFNYAGSDIPALPPVINPGRVVNVFTSIDCEKSCDNAFKQAHRDSKANVIDVLNVVFVGSTKSDQEIIFDWAREMRILKAELEAGRVVLHVDSGDWKRVREGDDVPQTIRGLY